MDIKKLYVLGVFEKGKLIRFVRKGRNGAISGYDNWPAAKRGLSQSKTYSNDDIRILCAGSLLVCDAETGSAHPINDSGEIVEENHEIN